MDLSGLELALQMIRSARVNAQRVELTQAVGTLNLATNKIKEFMEDHKPTTEQEEDMFFTDIEQMAHGFLCATLANPSMVQPMHEIDTAKLVHDSVQLALDLRGHVIDVRKSMQNDTAPRTD